MWVFLKDYSVKTVSERFDVHSFCVLRLFCLRYIKSSKPSVVNGVQMNTQEAKEQVELLKHLVMSRKETATTMNEAMHGFTNELRSTQKLWKKGNNSFLIKAGLALIAFPDPTISDVVGSAMVAAGLIQLKMRNSALHVEDVYKTFPKVVKELGTIKRSLV